MRKRTMLLLILAALAATPAPARQPSFEEYRAIQDSLSRLHPRLRERWLNKRGLEWPGINAPLPSTPCSDSGGLRLVGKWGRGPSVEVTGRDTLVFLSLGSEVAIINMADPDNPEVLSEPQARSIVVQSRVQGNILYVGDYAEVSIWDVTDPADPVKLSVIPYGVGDFAVSDSLLALTREGTFRVFSVADPANPRQLGTLPDNGTVHAVTGSLFLLIGYNPSGVYIIDCSDPAHPIRRGSISMDALAVEARGNLLVATKWWNGDVDDDDFWLYFYDISNPQNPHYLSNIHGIGGYDIHLSGQLAFVSGFGSGFITAIVEVSDSTSPHVISQCATSGDHRGIWAEWVSNRAYVADGSCGLTILDISNLNNPLVDTLIMRASSTMDVSVQGSYAYLANLGVKILDVADPASPREVGCIDSTFRSQSVAARDSFAFADWRGAYNLAAIEVSDPASPVLVGGCEILNSAEDMVLQDSFLYVAENYRFQVVNVARPSSPNVVATLSLPEYTYGMCIRDSLVYVTTYPFQIISVADPAAPRVVGSVYRGAWSVDVRDTFAFIAGGRGLFTYSVANPAEPRELDSLGFGSNTFDVVVVDSLAYVSTRAWLFVVGVADPSEPVVFSQYALPYGGWRVEYAEPYIYVAVQEAGVCIFEADSLAIAEPGRSEARRAFGIRPTVTRGVVYVQGGGMRAEGGAGIPLLDVAGRCVAKLSEGRNDLSGLSPGVYFAREYPASSSEHPGALTKLVIRR